MYASACFRKCEITKRYFCKGLCKSSETNEVTVDNKNLNSEPRIKASIDLFRSLYNPLQMKFYSINESQWDHNVPRHLRFSLFNRILTNVPG